MNILNLFKAKKEITNVTENENKKKSYVTQIIFPNGIVIAEQEAMVIPALIDNEHRYPAHIFDQSHRIPPVIIGTPKPLSDMTVPEEDALLKKAAQYDIRIKQILSEELPTLSESGKRIYDIDYVKSISLFIRPIFDIKIYPQYKDMTPKFYYIANDDFGMKQIGDIHGSQMQ